MPCVREGLLLAASWAYIWPENWQGSRMTASRLIQFGTLIADRSCCRPRPLLSQAQAQDRAVPRSGTELKLSFAPVVKRATPSVVNVYAAKLVENRNPLFDDPMFRRFFGAPGNIPREQMQRSLGSGVIVDAGGPRHHQQPCGRRRDRGEGLARRQARIRGRDRAEGCAHRSRGFAHQGTEGAFPGDRVRQFGRACRSATWCWRSAIRSASARP